MRSIQDSVSCDTAIGGSTKFSIFSQMTPSWLHLENGISFNGKSPPWQTKDCAGEVVFTTGMTGYDASLTDPSYAGQILVFTAPLIGNYGVPERAHWESERIYASGVVVCNLCEQWSHGQSTQSLLQWLENQGVALITGVDTRHLAKTLRESGTMHGTLSRSAAFTMLPKDPSAPEKVSVAEPIIYGAGKKKIIVVDCGMKSNILRMLRQFPATIKRVPHDYDYSQEEFDGVVLSNGPGNPEDYSATIAVLSKAMQHKKPIFGICLGHQLLALAAGARTCKLLYGHRGHNQPCIDLNTNRCYITSQNHGYAVIKESLPKGWQASFLNLNDETVEGIAHRSLPFFGVQFHPEAAPGPTDTAWIFDQFFALLK